VPPVRQGAVFLPGAALNASATWLEGGRTGALEVAVRGRDTSWYASGWLPSVEVEQAGGDRWRADRPPPDPRADSSPGRRGWRAGPLSPLTDGALEAHDARRRVVRVLRRAGYIARRWAVEEGRLLEGPAAGRPAVDPWRLAADLDQCGARWGVGVHLGGAAAAAPLSCQRRHVCPVCAGRAARQRAEAARAALRPYIATGREVALATFTQRDHAKDSLEAASARFRSAFKRLKRSSQWRSSVEGAIVGFEVTRGRTGKTWHYHAHAVVLLRSGVDQTSGRADLGRAWRAASAWAAERAGRPGYGWAPQAGGCNVARTGRVRSWAGGWWRPLDTLDSVKQACKYATPLAELQRPADVAEFVTHAKGRRWNEGAGVLRSYMAAAAEADDAAADDAAAPAAAAAAELGPRLTTWGPGQAPSLDSIAPGYGWRSSGRRARAEAGAPVLLVLARRYRDSAEAWAVLDGLGVRAPSPKGPAWAVERPVLAAMLGAAAPGPKVERGALKLPKTGPAARGLPPRGPGAA